MNIYDAVMKGPPRWARMLFLSLIILLAGVQIGLHKGRLQAIDESIGQTLEAKQRTIDNLVADLAETRRLLKKERDKLHIINCESGIRHEGIWGDNGASYGVAQFQYRTFDWMRTQAGKPRLKWKNRNDQLWLLDWALDQGYGKYWTCYDRKGGV